MNIIIAGAGVVGKSLAMHLNVKDNMISVIDRNPEACREISSRLDVLTIQGHATNPKVLLDAGIDSADMIIAVTPSDDVNLLLCNLAKQYKVPKRFARIKSNFYNPDEKNGINLEEVGVTDVIEHEKEIVQSILQYVELPGVTQTANLESGSVLLRGYRISEDMPAAGKYLQQINQESEDSPFLIVLIQRDNRDILPHGNEQILPGDQVFAIMSDESMKSFRKMINRPFRKHKKIIVTGDSLTARHLADTLKQFTERLIFVNPDPLSSEKAASEISDIEVINDDCTTIETLHEIHIEDTPLFIAADKDTEYNIMSCLLAKAEGAREVIAVSHVEKHLDLFTSLGVDHIILPNKITSQTIIANVLKMPIGALLKLKGSNVEVNRYTVEKRSRIIDRPLKEFGNITKKPVIIGTILRGDQVIIPNGETIIRLNDEILALCRPENRKTVRKIFKTKTTNN